MARERARDNATALRIAAIGYAQEQLSEGQASRKLMQRFGWLSTEAAIDVYRGAVESVAAGQSAQDLDPNASIGLAFGDTAAESRDVLLEATVRWDIPGGTQQEWTIRMSFAGSDSLADIMNRLNSEADRRNAESGRGDSVRTIEIDWIIAQ